MHDAYRPESRQLTRATTAAAGHTAARRLTVTNDIAPSHRDALLETGRRPGALQTPPGPPSPAQPHLLSSLVLTSSPSLPGSRTRRDVLAGPALARALLPSPAGGGNLAAAATAGRAAIWDFAGSRASSVPPPPPPSTPLPGSRTRRDVLAGPALARALLPSPAGGGNLAAAAAAGRAAIWDFAGWDFDLRLLRDGQVPGERGKVTGDLKAKKRRLCKLSHRLGEYLNQRSAEAPFSPVAKTLDHCEPIFRVTQSQFQVPVI